MTARSRRERVRGLVAASHPFPLLAVLILTAVVGLISADGQTDVGKLSLVVLAMLFSQLAIGWSNDYLDRHTDTLYQKSKPIASGLVAEEVLRILAPAAVLAALVVGLFLGVLPFLFLVIGTSAGLVYNLGVKNTLVSWLPFLVGLGVLPPFVWSALDSFRVEFVLLYPVGIPLAIAVHLANTIPDVDSDAAAGRAGLATKLNEQSRLVLLTVGLVAPPTMVGLSALEVTFSNPGWIIGGLVVYAGLITVTVAGYRWGRPGLAFKLVVLAAVALASSLLASL